ncbi:NYN domain-containing protein [Cellulomonas cellasea]|uniref:RNA-binding protein n=2 Tax=Cellulomonas cellasea TaxID=43670 RepID=A0A4Y3L0F7_9CELL|nr:NYN domain-containing protein [Cellulomonas cellasea]GEA89126.1 RNA-binding protein [Cellulomonas cellasea]
MADAPGQLGPTVPDAVRAVLVRLAAEVLSTVEPADVPATLRQVQRFAPRRRASAGALPLWSALEGDAAFRARVARVWAGARPDVAARLGRGSSAEQGDDGVPAEAGFAASSPGAEPPAPTGDATGAHVAAVPLDVAVGAWLLRPAGWADVVAEAAEELAAEPEGDDPGGALAGALDALRQAEDRATVLTAQLGEARARAERAEEDAATLRREQRRLRSDADRARSEARRVAAEAADVLAQATAARAAADEALETAHALRRAAGAERAQVRQEARVARDLAGVRVRLLLDTLVDAGQGLRAELALPPVGDRPADLVGTPAPVPAERATSRGRAASDPALLDDLLALPHAHLVVDGYNVSKAAWPSLSLAEQRRRLVDALANVAGRTGAEITCCFDGQEGPRPSGGGARGVRVLFSVGEIADDLIRRLVGAEPRGRVVVVVTSDRQVADDVEAAGARVVPSATLVARVARL